jgi:putative transposase
VKYAWIEAQRHTWPVRAMCNALEVSRSGYYEWRDRPRSNRASEHERLHKSVEKCFRMSRGAYGSPRVWEDLRAEGEPCGVHRVARLMKRAGLQARPKFTRKAPMLQDETCLVAANELQRNFKAAAPNERWVADFTYIETGEGWLYFAAVMDLYSRRIVGWSMSDKPDAQLVIDALLMALKQRGMPRGVMHHSDQGAQYTSQRFQHALRRHGLRCSMSRRGNCHDNAAMESFFSSMKTECINKTRYKTRDQARADAFDYVEGFYNPRRRHSTIGMISPVQFERQHGA